MLVAGCWLLNAFQAEELGSDEYIITTDGSSFYSKKIKKKSFHFYSPVRRGGFTRYRISENTLGACLPKSKDEKREYLWVNNPTTTKKKDKKKKKDIVDGDI